MLQDKHPNEVEILRLVSTITSNSIISLCNVHLDDLSSNTLDEVKTFFKKVWGNPQDLYSEQMV